METVIINGMKVNVVPNTTAKFECECCAFFYDNSRCASHGDILEKRCFEDYFHFEKPEEE